MNDNENEGLGAFWHFQFDKLARDLNERLNQSHNEAIANFRSLAKSTGQRTRSDRL